MLSDIENLDIMLGENQFNRNERDESISTNRARRPEGASGDEFENNDENRYLDARDIGPSTNADYSRKSTGGNSSAEINRLSSELISRLSRELDEMMSSVNTQIQRAIGANIASNSIRFKCRIGSFDTKQMQHSVRETGSKFRSSAECEF